MGRTPLPNFFGSTPPGIQVNRIPLSPLPHPFQIYLSINCWVLLYKSSYLFQMIRVPTSPKCLCKLIFILVVRSRCNGKCSSANLYKPVVTRGVTSHVGVRLCFSSSTDCSRSSTELLFSVIQLSTSFFFSFNHVS